MITVLNIPFNIMRNILDHWPFGYVMCILVNFTLMASVYASTFTMAAIAIDRYYLKFVKFSTFYLLFVFWGGNFFLTWFIRPKYDDLSGSNIFDYSIYYNYNYYVQIH